VLSASHIFLPVGVETAGTWNQSAIELIQEIGRRITAVTEDTRETAFLFQRLSIALQGAMWLPFWLHSTPCHTPQPSIPPGSVNEYQLRLGRQRQVWFIPLVDERGVCR